MSHRPFNPKNRFLGQKLCPVARWAPFQISRIFPFNLSSRIGPIFERPCIPPTGKCRWKVRGVWCTVHHHQKLNSTLLYSVSRPPHTTTFTGTLKPSSLTASISWIFSWLFLLTNCFYFSQVSAMPLHVRSSRVAASQYRSTHIKHV